MDDPKLAEGARQVRGGRDRSAPDPATDKERKPVSSRPSRSAKPSHPARPQIVGLDAVKAPPDPEPSAAVEMDAEDVEMS